MVSRRDFLKVSALTAASATCIGVGAALLTENPLIRRDITISIPELPRSFHGYRIAFITDIHLGVFVPNEWIEQAVSLASAAKPDILVLGGDYIWLQSSASQAIFGGFRNPMFDGPLNKELGRSIFRTAASIIRGCNPPDGILAVYGNHDRWVGPEDCRQSFHERGITLLVNEAVSVKRGGENLTFIGVDDFWTGFPKLPSLAPRVAGKEGRVVISHNPDYVSLLVKERATFDLALCGHTHGGQIRLPLFGALVHNIRDHRFFDGHAIVGSHQSYTSRGIGFTGLPYRVNCPSEVAVITLQTA